MYDRGRIGVLAQHVGALCHQCFRCLAFLAGVVPGVDPNDFGLDAGIHASRTQRVSVDIADDFRNRIGTHEAESVRFRHLARQHAEQVCAFVKARFIGHHIRRGLEARGVAEAHFRKQLGDLQRRFHVAERCRVDQIVARRGQLADDALRIGGCGNVIDEGGLHFRAQSFFQRSPAQIVLV